ncbi:MAG: DUF4198 domain-containing protein [Burkholderiaceae bacterium]
MRQPALLAALFAACIATPVAAHDTWLQPRRAAVLPGTIAQLDLTSGDKFPAHETAIKQERIEVARVRLNGNVRDISERAPEKKSLELRTALSDPGIATLWLSLAPHKIELNSKQVKHYLQEIDAPELLGQAWYAGKQSKPWREIYTKHAKAFVLVGRPGRAKSDRSWSQPVGLALEIVPEKDPTSLQAGDEFPVRVLKNGAPLADLSLGIVREGGTNRAFRTTDANGRAVFKVPRAGKWLLRGTDLRQSSKPATDWESDFTTLMFEVK